MTNITMFETPEDPPTRGPASAKIYQAIVDLANCNQVATRQVLMEQTGYPYGIVDDNVKRHIEKGKVRRVVSGVFEAVLERAEDLAV